MTSAAGAALRSRSFSYCSWTCIASSRVGTRMSAENFPRRTLRRQAFDHRDQVRQRLAGAGLRRSEYVFSLKCRRDSGRLDRHRGNEMGVCQLLLEPSRQGHIFELSQTNFSFWRGVSRGCIQDASREDTTEAALILFGAENETEAGKGGDQINVGSDIACKRPQPIASTVIIGMHRRLCKRRTVTSRTEEIGVQSLSFSKAKRKFVWKA